MSITSGDKLEVVDPKELLLGQSLSELISTREANRPRTTGRKRQRPRRDIDDDDQLSYNKRRRTRSTGVISEADERARLLSLPLGEHRRNPRRTKKPNAVGEVYDLASSSLKFDVSPQPQVYDLADSSLRFNVNVAPQLQPQPLAPTALPTPAPAPVNEEEEEEIDLDSLSMCITIVNDLSNPDGKEIVVASRLSPDEFEPSLRLSSRRRRRRRRRRYVTDDSESDYSSDESSHRHHRRSRRPRRRRRRRHDDDEYESEEEMSDHERRRSPEPEREREREREPEPEPEPERERERERDRRSSEVEEFDRRRHSSVERLPVDRTEILAPEPRRESSPPPRERDRDRDRDRDRNRNRDRDRDRDRVRDRERGGPTRDRDRDRDRDRHRRDPEIRIEGQPQFQERVTNPDPAFKIVVHPPQQAVVQETVRARPRSPVAQPPPRDYHDTRRPSPERFADRDPRRRDSRRDRFDDRRGHSRGYPRRAASPGYANRGRYRGGVDDRRR